MRGRPAGQTASHHRRRDRRPAGRGPSFEFVPIARSACWPDRISTIKGRKRPQPRGARPAEYRRPASRLGRFLHLSDGLRRNIPLPLRRSPHGSGRSAPSRAASLSWLAATLAEAFPLDRALGRPPIRASVLRSSSSPVELTSLHLLRFMTMPLCANCPHPGTLHNWRVQRIRGRCDYPKCDCRGYVPATKSPRPVTSYIGRLRWKK